MADRLGVYLDSCCFIDMVKIDVGQTLSDDLTEDVWFLKQLCQACRDGEIDVFTSILTIAECVSAGEDVSQAVQDRFSALLMSGQYVKLVQPTPFIATDARDLRWHHGINVKGADGVHVASALDRKCEEFITTDRGPKKAAAKVGLAALGLRVIRAADTHCLPTQYRQTKMKLGDA